MWLEYIRYRFRLNETQSGLELAQIAAVRALRNSPRCRSWRVLPAPSDPTLCILEIEWDPGESLTPFRGSDEFAQIHAALTEQVKALEEADYRANSRLLQRILGGPEALFRLAEDIVVAVMEEPALGSLFESDDGSKRGRLGLWLLEALGGPGLFSSSFPAAKVDQGPLAEKLLDLEERECLLEIARDALPSSSDERGLCVLGSLRACVPLHPLPPSRLGPRRLAEVAESAVRARVAPDALGVPSLSSGADASRTPWRLARTPGRPAGTPRPDSATRRTHRSTLRKQSSS